MGIVARASQVTKKKEVEEENIEDKRDLVSLYWQELCWLKNLFKGKTQIDDTLQLPVNAETCHDYVNDYIILLLTRLLDWSKVVTIDFRGCEEITDLGIKWLCEKIPECSRLTKLHLDGCVQLTEVGLQYILRAIPRGVELSMRGTNVAYVSRNCEKFLTSRDFDGCLAIPYYSTPDRTMTSGLLIWQDSAIKESCLHVLMHNQLVPFPRPGINYERQWTVRNEDSTEQGEFTVLELNTTESPIHSLLPREVNQVVIVVNDEEERARKHIVKSIVYFLGKQHLQPGVCEFEEEVTVRSLSQTKLSSLIPSNLPEVDHYPPINTISQGLRPMGGDDDVDIFLRLVYEKDPPNVYYNMVVQNEWRIPHYLSAPSFWMSTDTSGDGREIFRVFITPSFTNASYGIGWCSEEPASDAIDTFTSVSSQHNILLNITKRELLLRDSWRQLPHFSTSKEGFIVELGIDPKPQEISVTLTINNDLIYSDTVKPNGVTLRPCIFCACGADENLRFSILPNVSVKESPSPSGLPKFNMKKKEPLTVTSGTNFVLVCAGKEAEKTKEKLEKFNLKDALQVYVDKLVKLENEMKGNVALPQDFQLQSRLAHVTITIDHIRHFLSEIDDRVAYFSLDMINFENQGIKDQLLKNVLVDKISRPHLYVDCRIAKAIDQLNKRNSTVKLVSLQTIADILSSKKSYGFLRTVLQRRHNLCQCIFLEELNVVIEDPPWFYKLLHTFATRPTLKSSGRVMGLPPDAAVWTEAELQATLKSWQVDDDVTMDLAVKALIHVGALMLLPCLRHHTDDENLVYSSVFAAGQGDIDPLETYRKAREGEPRLALASRIYHVTTADLYSCFLALLSKVSRLGQLQALSFSGAVFHVGGAEVMILPKESSLELSAYCHEPEWPQCLESEKDIHIRRLFTCLWSILHLFTDCMDVIVKENQVLVHVSNCTPEPVNNSVGYFHNWSNEVSTDHVPYTVCTLCHNCSSSKGSKCSFNRIHGNHISQCLCMEDVTACLNCGLCKDCANYLWNIHTTANPNRLLTFAPTKTPCPSYEQRSSKLMALCAEPLQISMKPCFSVTTYQTTTVALCLKRDFYDNGDVISLLDDGARKLQLSSISGVTLVEPTRITVRISEISKEATRRDSNTKTSVSISLNKSNEDTEMEQWIRSLPFTYTVCRNMHIIPYAGVLTYDVEELPAINNEVGLFVGPKPMPENDSVCFEFEILNRGTRETITIGLVPHNYPANAQPGRKENSIAYHVDDGKIFRDGVVRRTFEKFSNSGKKVGVSLLSPKDVREGRLVNFFLDGQLVYEGVVSGTLPLYPAVGMHSMNEQVRLSDSTYWTPLENEDERRKEKEKLSSTDYVEVPYIRDPFRESQPRIMLRFLAASKSGRATHAVAHLHFSRVEDAPFRVQFFPMDENVPLEIRYVTANSKKPSSVEEHSGRKFKLDGNRVIHSFLIKSPFRGLKFDKNQAVLRLVLTPNLNKPESQDELLCYYSVQRLPSVIQTDKLFVEPYDPDEDFVQPSYLLEVDTDGICKKYRISAGNYQPYLVYEDLRKIHVSFKNYPPVAYTNGFIGGNLLRYDETTGLDQSVMSMVKSVDVLIQTLMLNNRSAAISFNSNCLYPLTTDMLEAESPTDYPLSYPSPMILENIENYLSMSHLIYIPRGRKCDPRLGQTFIELEALVVGGNRTGSVSTFPDLGAALPLTNATNVPHLFLPLLEEDGEEVENVAFNHILVRHSVLQLTGAKNLRIYAYCEKINQSAEFQELIHILDHAGIEPQSQLKDENVFFNKSVVRAYLQLLRQKLIICSHEKLVQTTERVFSKHEVENFLHSMLHKYASYCLMVAFSPFISKPNELQTTFKDLSSEFTTSTSDAPSCETHRWESFDLSNIMKEDTDIMVTLEQNTMFQYAECLVNLSLRGEKVKRLPESFFVPFKNVKQLTIAGMPVLESLPTSLCDLRYLQNLTINATSVTNLPDQFTCLTNLRVLSIESSNMQQLCGQLSNDNRLKRLRIFKTPLEQFSPAWCLCDSLVELVLEDIPLSDLPPEFANLKNLTLLKITGPHYTEDAFCRVYSGESISAKSALQTARERNSSLYSRMDEPVRNQLNEISDTKQLAPFLFIRLPRLGLGHSRSKSESDGTLLHHDTGGIPPCLFQLKKLVDLRLNRHAIRFVPDEAVAWEQLNTLDLSKNPLLESVSEKIGTLKNLKNLDLCGCASLKTPPEEVVNRGSDTCIAFLKSLLSKEVICRRTKLMFVGLGGAGKTTLLRALMSDNNRTTETAPVNITHGIDITQWEVSLEDENSLTYSTWDFAGQSVYYNTHQFFLSKRAVYLLLWSVRLGYEHAGLDFWLSSIMCHAPNAPILVVGTHADQVEKITIPRKLYQKRYPQIVGFHTVSSITGLGIADLKEVLFKTTLSQSYMGEKIPQLFLDFESQLITQRRTKDILQLEDVQTIAMQCGIHDEKEIHNAVHFLHDLGSLQFFDMDFLRDHVVINPQWIVNVMACVVSVKKSLIENGIFYHRNFRDVWNGFSAELHQWLLQLTEEFDLTFPLPSTAFCDANDSRANIVPCLLPDEVPQIDWPPVDSSSDMRETKVVYRFSYLPAGLFNRIQVRLFEFSDGKKIWKTGSLLKKNAQIGLLTQEAQNILTVRVQGCRPENFVFMIHEVIDSIVNQSFLGIQYELLVPCPECTISQGEFQDLKEGSFFESSLVKRANRKNVSFLQCHIDFHDTSIRTMLGLLPPSSDKDHNLHLQRSLSNLFQMRRAISYSYVEEDFSEYPHVTLEEILQRLSKFGVACGDLTQMKQPERKQHLRDFGLYVVFLSQRYTENKELFDLYHYARDKLKKPICVVCVGESKDWTDSNLAMLIKDDIYTDLTAKKAKETNINNQLTVLEENAQKKLSPPGQEQGIFDCFLSYCHSNSHAGAASGDPRAVYEFLKNNEIKCWIDTVCIGSTPLYDAIYHGLIRSKVFICFVSNEYTVSKNCDLEYSFATNNLHRPIIYVHVGGEISDQQRITKIDMMKHKFPGRELNMVGKSETVYQELLTIVKEELAKAPTLNIGQKKFSSTKKTSLTAFKEEAELAQQNFLKQLQNFTLKRSLKPYPRLLLIDFLGDPTTEPVEEFVQSVTEWSMRVMCLRVLCENERGWHLHGQPIQLPQHSALLLSVVNTGAAYLHPLYQLARSSGIDLNCFHGGVGDTFLAYVDEREQRATNNCFEDPYVELHRTFMEFDEGMKRGNLDRCKLGSGKILWLCLDHQKQEYPRVRCLPVDDNIDTGKRAVQEGERALKELLLKEADNEDLLYGDSYATSLNKHLSYLQSRKQAATSGEQPHMIEPTMQPPPE